MRFILCSDLHIAQDYAGVPWRTLGWRRVLGLLQLGIGGRAAAYQHAEATTRAIVAGMAQHQADHLLVAGDVSTYCTHAEFKAARAALSPIADTREQCSAIPGNHDYFTRGAANRRRFEQYFGHLTESDWPEYRREGPYPYVQLKGDDVAIIGLKSPRIMPFPGFSYGRVGAAQLNGLDAILADRRLDGRAVLVLVHHAPLDPHGPMSRRAKFTRGLHDGSALLRRLQGPRFAVLHGHVHHRFHHEATATSPHIFGAGSSTLRGREGYWVIETAGGAISGARMHSLGASL